MGLTTELDEYEVEDAVPEQDVGVAIEIRQGGLQVMHSRHPELLLEGPAGTGKTFFLVWWAHQLCELFPGIRIYFVRQTRKSLNNSAMSLYEDLLGYGHPVLESGGKRSNRDEYIYPHRSRVTDPGDGKGPRRFAGSSMIYLLGMDNPDRLMSTEGDVAMFFEATEGNLDGWDKLGSRMRRGYLPWNFRVADVNPGPATHWLNVRADETLVLADDLVAQLGESAREMPKMQRVRTTLKDNPKYWDTTLNQYTQLGVEYKIKLASLSPVNRLRLEDGEWVSSAGQVYEGYRSEKHIVQGSVVQRDGYWHLEPYTNEKLGIMPQFRGRRIEWFGVSADWGYYPDPTVLQLWAFDIENNAFLVEEHYETRIAREVTGQRIADWQGEYDVRAVVCDHDPDMVRLINELIGRKHGGGRPIAQNADKAILPGIDVVRWCLEDDDGCPDDKGEQTRKPEPRMRFLSGSIVSEDETLKEELRPTSTVAEIGSYAYVPRVDGKSYQTDKPDPKCDDHGCDAMRYMMMYAWRHKHKAPLEPTGYKPGTMGAKFNHAKRFRDAAKRRRRA